MRSEELRALLTLEPAAAQAHSCSDVCSSSMATKAGLAEPYVSRAGMRS